MLGETAGASACFCALCEQFDEDYRRAKQKEFQQNTWLMCFFVGLLGELRWCVVGGVEMVGCWGS